MSFRLQYGLCFFFLVALQLLPSQAEEEELRPHPSTVVQPLLASYQAITPQDPSEEQPDEFAPYKIDLSAAKKESLPPEWAPQKAYINEKESTIEFFLPALSEQPKIDTFVLTVVFYDLREGSPRIEWKGKNESSPHCICSGLGGNETLIGLNSRTIQIQTKENDVNLIDGGTLIIRHTGRLRQIVSATLRPARQLNMVVLGEKISSAIINESLNVIEQDVTDDTSSSSSEKKEKKNKNLSTKLLSRNIECFEKNKNEQEVLLKSMPLTKRPRATLLHTDLQGLDLTSSIEVELNGIFVGTLNTSLFRLDAPELILEKKTISSFELAGWQRAHLFIPPQLWKKNNQFVFTIKRGSNATPSKVHVKNLFLELLY